MITTLTIAILFLVANAFFVAAEFALVKLKIFRTDALADSGNHTAKLTQRIHRNMEPHLTAKDQERDKNKKIKRLPILYFFIFKSEYTN